MNFNRVELLAILESVYIGVDARGVIEHSASFVFTGKEVRTYNDQVAVRFPLVTEFTGAIEAEKFLKLLRGLEVEELDLSLAKGEGEIIIKAGKAEAGLTLQETSAEWLSTLAIPKKWLPLPSNFYAALKMCLLSVAKDLTRPVLSTIHLSPTRAESCDNYRATRWDLKGPKGPEAAVAGSAVRSFLNTSATHYAVVEGWLHLFENEGAIISSRLFGAEEYPSLDSLFAVEGSPVQLPESIRGLVDRAHVFAEAEFAQDERLTLSLDKNTVTVSGKGQKGWYKETSKCIWKGKALAFDVHPSLFGDMVDLDREVIIGETLLKLQGDGLVHVVALSAGEG